MMLGMMFLNHPLAVFAQEQGIQNFQKMKYGFFVHYVWGGSAYTATVNPVGIRPAGLDELADGFDPREFAEDLASIKIEYVIFTAWHANMNCLWPSPKMQHWLPGHASRRDVLRDMISAVRAKGIRVILYTHPSDGHDLTPAEQLATGWGPVFDRTKWNDFINDLYGDLIFRYGNDIEGVYLDENRGKNAEYVDYARLYKTIKAGNPSRLILQNDYGSIYNCDLGDREVISFGSSDENTWPAPGVPSAAMISFNWWASEPKGHSGLRYSPESIFRYTVLTAGISGSAGGIAWAAGNYCGGGWETGVLETMRRVADYLQPVARSITNTRASTSYVTGVGATLQSLLWGVATKSTDDRYEYLHVLKPPIGKTLALPAPADFKMFGSARLLAGNQKVSLKQNLQEVTLTLPDTTPWNSLDTVIALKVTGYRRVAKAITGGNFPHSNGRLGGPHRFISEVQSHERGDGTFQIPADSVATLTGDFASGRLLTLGGGGTLIVATNLTYPGPTLISGGTLKLCSYTPAPGMARWFDAAYLGLTNGATVNQWDDLSGHDARAVRAAGDNALPTYVADARTGTGLGAIHFGPGTGVNPALNSQTLTFPTDANIRTIFSVFKGGSFLLTDHRTIHFHRPDDANPTSPLWTRDYSSPNVLGGRTYVNNQVVDGTLYPMPTNSHGGFNLVEVLATNVVTGSGFNKDRYFHAGDQFQAEVVIYDFALNETQRRQTEAYLNAKWFGIGTLSNLLPVTTAVILSRGGVLDLNGINQTCGTLSATDHSGCQVKLGRGTLTLDGASGAAFDGIISGPGGLVKSGGNTLTLTGRNDYDGKTLVTGGKLRVNESLGTGAVEVASKAILEACGQINGAVRINDCGTITLGPEPGSLVIDNDLTLLGTNVMKVSKTLWRKRNDIITGISTLTYGGVLNVVSSGRPLARGDSFKLFDATHYLGKFAGIVPPAPGVGLAWDAGRLAVDGTVQVKSALCAGRD